jgi:hypothetical protein
MTNLATLHLTRDELEILERCVKRALGSSDPCPMGADLWPLHTALIEARTGLELVHEG